MCDKIKDKIDKIIRYDEIKTAAQTEGGEDDLQDQINPKPGLTWKTAMRHIAIHKATSKMMKQDT